MKYLLTPILFLFCGCASLADFVAEDIVAVFEPQSIQLEDGRAGMTYALCDAEAVVDLPLSDFTKIASLQACVTIYQEFTRFEVDTEDGGTIECVAVYVEPTWPDNSQNHWLKPADGSDPRCLEAMEAAVEKD